MSYSSINGLGLSFPAQPSDATHITVTIDLGELAEYPDIDVALFRSAQSGTAALLHNASFLKG